ncbi:MAG: polysaccharide biosynthesis tyrosine autokinase [Xanthomonadaceae bacterium]|nr:polysaccharide biosynthesis tyrosine autokinase [Xanthomonadaceae bacterium]
MTDSALDRDAAPRPADGAGGNGPDDDEISLLEYGQVIYRRRWLVLGVTGLVMFIALVATLLMTPLYRATTTLQINRDTIKVVDVQGMTPAESFNDQDFYQTQYELLQSHSLARRVISHLDLAHDPVFKRMQQPSPLGRLLGLLHPGAGARTPEALDHDDVKTLLGALSIEPIRNSRLVAIHVDTPDPKFSARVANAYADAFIQSNLERRMEGSSYAKSYLDDRLQQLKQRLEDSDKELVAFAQKEQIINLNTTVNAQQSLIGQQLGELNTALAQAEQDRYKAEGRWQQVQAMHGDALPQVLEDRVVQELRRRYAEDVAKYQDQLRLYKPAYPQMQQLKAQIDELHQQIADQVTTIKGSIEGDYLAAKAHEDLLHTRVAALKQQYLNLEQRSIRYNILKREVDTNRQLYDALLQRYKEIAIAGGVGINNVLIVDRAHEPQLKYRPVIRLNLAVALVLGLFGGVLLALLLERLDDTVKNATDVEHALGLATLGVIPLLREQTPEQALADARSGFAEAYRSMRTALQFATADGAPRVLLITSTRPGEGKSTTASALAHNFVQLDQRVLLIDADLRNPSQHRGVAIDNTRGLSNVLAGAMAWREVVHSPANGGPAVMACGPLPPNPAELLAGPRLTTLLEEARAEYDFVILDAPPVLGLADAPLLGHLAAGTVLVIEAGATRLEHVRDALKRLAVSRTRVVGAVLTKLDTRQTGYGYGYGAHYYAYGGASPESRRSR